MKSVNTAIEGNAYEWCIRVNKAENANIPIYQEWLYEFLRVLDDAVCDYKID